MKDIQKLIEILEKSDLEVLEYKNDQFEVKLKKASHAPVVQNVAMPVSEKTVALEAALENTINAPLVGVFYSKQSPDKPAFVSKGMHVESGDILCIIEAMKVMNEIKATTSGVIEEILVKDGDAVSFDQPLFKIV